MGETGLQGYSVSIRIPPYGFYILNRVGMDDYIQWLYPEDSIQVLSCFHNQAIGSYLPIIALFQQICARLDDGTEGQWREGTGGQGKGT